VSVAAGQNVLAAALAAGIPLPHSCRAGRCASCKATLIAGTIAYPGDALPPGIVSAEAMKGEVLLCQAQPRSHLVVKTRVIGGGAANVPGAAGTVRGRGDRGGRARARGRGGGGRGYARRRSQ
jgi:ferredoxin